MPYNLGDNVNGVIATFTGIRFEDGYVEDAEDAKPQTAQCSFDWCIKTSASRVVESAFDDAIIEDYAVRVDGASCCVDTSEGLMCDAYKSANSMTSAVEGEGQSAPSQPHTTFSSCSATAAALPTSTSPPRDGPYRITITEANSLQTNIMSLFDRSKIINSRWAEILGTGSANTISAGEALLYARMESKLISPLQQALYSSSNGNLSCTIEDVARSMTNRLRNDADAVQVQDRVLQPVPHFHVRWSSMVYPASIPVLAALFLVASLVFSQEREGLMWKSSQQLPLLFHSLQGLDVDDRTFGWRRG